MKIQKLSPLLINQIAAGEVIERPASVVKELVENSCDAGASKIDIEIEKGGLQLISIKDDGCGIDKADLPLAITSHATSKIQSFADLENVHSMGFRGEALASISSISRFCLASCVRSQETGWQIKLAGREEEAVIQAYPHPVGTTITVRDLFFNTPARRKFMRTPRTELLHIEEVIKRLALARFDLAISLKHDGRDLLNLKPAKNRLQQEKRIAKIFGKAFLDHARVIEIERSGMQLWGWLGLPSFHRSQSDMQFFYINGRMVKDKLLGHAIRQAYAESVYEGRYPAFCLHFHCDPGELDVNVHPTKHEVRFRQARLVHDFIFQSLQKVLQITPHNDAAETAYDVPIATQTQLQIRETIAHYEPKPIPAVIKSGEEIPAQMGRYMGLCHQRYALLEHSLGLVAIDLSVLQQHLARENLLHDYANTSLSGQLLLIPETLTFPEKQITDLQKCFPRLEKLGISLNVMGLETIIGRALPQICHQAPARQLFSALFAALLRKPEMSDQDILLLMAQQVGSATRHYTRQEVIRLLTALADSEDWEKHRCCQWMRLQSAITSFA